MGRKYYTPKIYILLIYKISNILSKELNTLYFFLFKKSKFIMSKIPPSKKIKTKTLPSNFDEFLFKQLEQDFNVQRRRINLIGEILSDTPAMLQERIDLIADLSGDKTTPITINITSPGGDVYGMFGAIDVIRDAPMPINTHAVGAAMSAAAVFLAAGTGSRSITKHTFVMIHEVSTWVEGSTQVLFTEVKQVKLVQDIMNNLLAEFTKKPKTYWQKLTGVNLYVAPEQCVEFGLVDKIWTI